ncbi:MAG: hypothetical protein KC619_03760 [Myxococcales bacterium]|nr:hypothetical protein [Myxococcales bacterium]
MLVALGLSLPGLLAGCSVIVDHFSFVDPDAGLEGDGAVASDASLDADVGDGGTDGGVDGGGCLAPTTLCGAFCVNLASDAEHCGTCDRACAGGVGCLDGACVDVLRFVRAGASHTCGVRGSGAAVCWGANGFGQLGDGTTTDSTTPTIVTGVADFQGVIPMIGTDAVDFTCGLSQTGQGHCWGGNPDGAFVPGGATVTRPMPMAITGLSDAIDIAGNRSHVCAVRGTGSVLCFGRNNYGQLGTGDTTSRMTPVVVPGVDGAANVAAGSGFSCAALSSGRVQCWGRGTAGQLGDGRGMDSLSPVEVSGLTDAVYVAASGFVACALRETGEVACWGDDSDGLFGSTPPRQELAPVAVPGVDSAEQLSVGNGHACVLLADASVACWGQNLRGQLGDGTTTPRLSPTPVMRLGGSAAYVTAGRAHTCAVMTATGGIRCWGDNSMGQLGDGSTTDSSTPIDVVGLP